MILKSGASKRYDANLLSLGVYGAGMWGLLFKELLSADRLKQRLASFVDESNTRVAKRRACHGTD